MKTIAGRRIVDPRALLGPRGAYSIAVGLAGCGAFSASLLVSPGVAGFGGGALALLMMAIAICDWRHFRIPDELTVLALLTGFATFALATPGDRLAILFDSAIRAICAAAAFFAFRWIYRWARGREGIGLGDVKLAGVAGLWLTWQGVSIAVEIAAISALCVFAARQRMKARAFRSTVRVPFGAFFAPAIWLCWLLEALVYVN